MGVTTLIVTANNMAIETCNEVQQVASYADAIATLKKARFDSIIVEFCDDAAFKNFTRDVKAHDTSIHIVVSVPVEFKPNALKILANGADDIVTGPIDAVEFKILMKRLSAGRAERNEIRYRRVQMNAMSNEVIGRSEPMMAIFRMLDKVATCIDPVLISGAPGSGKKLHAWSLHIRSLRRGAAYFVVNCSAYPGGMLEQELFGSPRRGHAGALESCEGGTLVLENIDAMTAPIQERLLNLMKDNGTANFNVRFICLTAKDLDAEVSAGRFNPELLSKLKQCHMALPPLRERAGDVMLVGEYFYRRYCAEMGVNPAAPEAGFWEALSAHTWPGNVRELSNVMYHTALLCLEKKAIQPSGVQVQASSPSSASTVAANSGGVASTPGGPNESVFKIGIDLETVELEIIQKTVLLTKGNRTQAANILGISVRSLYNKMMEVEKRAAAKAAAAAAQTIEPANASTNPLVASQCA